MSDLDFAGVAAAPGQMTRGAIHASELFGGTRVDIPVAVVNGAERGRRVWIIAGTHGDEIEAIVATQRVLQDIDPKRLRGSIVAILAANPAALDALTHESPGDHKDLNRVFPGDAAGTYSDRLADLLFTEIRRRITPDDIVLNLHGGGTTILTARLIELRGTGDDIEERSTKIAEMACNPDLRVIARVEERTGAWATTYRGSLLRELHDVVPAARITVEAGGLGRLDPSDVGAHHNACLNVMRGLGMIAGEVVAPTEPLIRTSENSRLFPSQRGFWIAHVAAGDHVEKDQTIAEVTNIYGDVVEELRSPYTGIVLYMRKYGIVDPQSGALADRYGANVGRVD